MRSYGLLARFFSKKEYLQVGCGKLCGYASFTIGAADSCPVVEATGFSASNYL